MRFAFLAVLAVFLACGGDPEEGQRCTQHRCSEDEQSAFFCDNGFYVKVPCRGFRGCFQEKRNGVLRIFACDVSANQTGDRCDSEHDGHVVCLDKTHGLVCSNAFFRRRECTVDCVSSGGLPEDDPGQCL